LSIWLISLPKPSEGLRVTINHLLFLLMSLIWGVTWIATKAGIAVVPPVFFGAARYVLVSIVLVIAVRDLRAIFTGRVLRLVVTGTLVNTATYAFIYWGMLFVASGVAGVINMSMNPVFLFGFAFLLGQEKPSWRHAAALCLGAVGLVILFSNKASFGGSAAELWGAAAVVAGSLSYCLGSVLARPLLDELTPVQLTAAQALVGAAGLAALSLLLEPVTPQTLYALLAPAPLAGLLFVVVGGTFVAYNIFLRLMRDWGAPRAGLYSFVSPVVALILGAIIFAEPLTWREMTGAAIMLLAAAIAVIRPPAPDLPAG
jgi:drug/metabolite transporter (DMT)-like permease